MSELDRLIHEPARPRLVALLSGAEEADFLFLQRETGLTKGNLSSHLMRLEKTGTFRLRTFRGKIPLTLERLTPDGPLAGLPD